MIQTLTEKSSGVDTAYIEDVIIVFNGPIQHYITPKFYVQTKPDTGKVVPTWDYSAIQVYGRARIFYDTSSAESSSFLSNQLHGLSLHAEKSIMGYGSEGGPKPWEVSDAPGRYIDLLQKGIIGIEVEISSMEGRFK
jgi:transcriptional regulator